MAQPQAYNRETDFTERDGDDTNHAGINTELDAAALSINEIRNNLALIQRDDGALKNGIVTAESLSDSAFNAVLGEVATATAAASASADRSTLFATQAEADRIAAQAAAAAAQSSQTAAAGSATTATTKAAEAASSATSAATSASTATTKASEASTSATNAANSATASAGSATTASTQATNAATSASAAATSATNSANSATTATTQAGIATTQASNAAASAVAAASSFDDFDDRYLGPKSAAPTIDNDGNPLLTGAMYFDTSISEMRVYTGTVWKAVGSAINGTTNRATYTATAGQTTFAIVYDVGFVDVYLNGLKLQAAAEFTATNGTSIVLATGATAGDIVDIVAYGVFSVANLNASLVAATDGAGGSLFTTVAGFITRLMSSAGSALMGFIQSGTGALQRTAQDKMREVVSLTDFAAGNGTSDDTSAIQAAVSAASAGQWIDGLNKTYLISGVINVTSQLFRMRNAKFVFNTGYSNQGRFELNAGSGTTAMTVELENIFVDGGRGTYKVGSEPWQVFTSLFGYDSITPTLGSTFRVTAYNANTYVRIKNVNFYNVHSECCVEVGTYGTVFIDDCEYKNISNKTFHVYHSPDDGVTQAGRTLVNNVYAQNVGMMPAAFTVGGVAKVRADAYAPQGSFNFIVSHGDFTINNAIVWNYASCGVTADRNRSFTSNNVFIYHDDANAFSNNPSGAFWLEACKRSSVSNLVIDVQNRDSRDTALDSCAFEIYMINDQQLVANNIVIRGNTSAAKLRRAIRGSVQDTCQITISNFYVNGLYTSTAINFGQLPSSVIGSDIRLKNGHLLSGSINVDQTKLLDIDSVKVGGNISVSVSGNSGITGTVDDVSVSRSTFGSFTNSATITRSLRISDNDSTGSLACNSVSGQLIIDGNQQIGGAISASNSAARIGIHDNALITDTTIISSAKDVRFTGNNTNRRVQLADVQTFSIVGNTIKTDAPEPIIWINPVTASNVLAGVISSNNVLVKTGTVGAGYVAIGGGVVGVTDVNNNKLAVNWT
jgi:hypothetical protein